MYPAIPDVEAAKHGYPRVIDESGEDYWHSANRFVKLRAPESQAKALRERLGPWGQRPGKALKTVTASRRRLNA